MMRSNHVAANVTRIGAAALILLASFGLGIPVHAAPPAAQPGCHGAPPIIWITQDTAAGAVTSQDALPACTAGTPADATITVDPQQRRQRILGFGAALTGSAAWLLQTHLHPRVRRDLLQELFAPPPAGIGLSLLRLPIGSSDLSRGRYSLAPVAAALGKPVTLDLSPWEQTTLPALHGILGVNPDIRIIASPWSPPAWMKTTNSLIGGRLKPGQEEHLASYLTGFLQQMSQRDIPIFAVTLQNEPNVRTHDYPGMLMSADQAADIIDRFLGPMLTRARLDTRILALDDNWMWVRHATETLDDRTAAHYIKGIAWHCYGGQSSVQDIIHRRYPSMLQLLTECSDGDWAPNNQESIAGFVQEVFISPLRHWDSGVILWGLALDPNRGPHDGGCGICTPVVTVGDAAHPVTFTRDYYALAHFSRFVRAGAYQVASNTPGNGLTDVAFADGERVAIVIANRNAAGKRVQVMAGAQSTIVDVPAKSVTTVAFGQASQRATGASKARIEHAR